MRLVRHTVRLPVSTDRALRTLAERQDLSSYAMLQQCVEAGIAALGRRDNSLDEIIAELASVSTRMVDTERLIDRALFTSCAAYCYARVAAMGSDLDDSEVTAEICAAYDRQRQMAQEVAE